VILLLLASVAGAGCAAGQSRPEATPDDGASTRYRVGDRVVYQYRGSSLEAPVTLTEQIVAREGNRLEIEVTSVRGSERRQWVQVVTDTPENQRNNVIDELYEVLDGQRQRLANEGNGDLLRLYGWTLPPLEGPLTPEVSEEVTVEIAGETYHCTREAGLASLAGRAARMVGHTCPGFLWTNGAATLIDIETGDLLWEVTVVEASRP
jgi:hypothetical protein